MTPQDLESAGWKKHRSGWKSPYTQTVMSNGAAMYSERLMVKARAVVASLKTFQPTNQHQ